MQECGARRGPSFGRERARVVLMMSRRIVVGAAVAARRCRSTRTVGDLRAWLIGCEIAGLV